MCGGDERSEGTRYDFECERSRLRWNARVVCGGEGGLGVGGEWVVNGGPMGPHGGWLCSVCLGAMARRCASILLCPEGY